ncbi:MAG: type I 3-dehydroquinate dehydratase [Candidatus Methanomethyliaceae archaeon]|nr:type I 3-dehydroquinate dehydratase [Candidatus Methanomethyliaceae archaeon]MDW7970567.1 type I 3-dehydroquinate dehydratase [Nitrososphaerota archaeon]
MCKVCVSIADEERILESIEEAMNKGADLVEIRLDYIKGLNEGKIEEKLKPLRKYEIPKIATIMPKFIFGRFEGSAQRRIELLIKASDYVDFIDIGAEVGENLIKNNIKEFLKKTNVIISWHLNQSISYDEICSIVKKYGDYEVIHKVVMPARGLEDNIVALKASSSLKNYKRIIFCYGEGGVISRLLCPFFGSEWTYAALKEDMKTAPGQITIEKIKFIYERLKK